MVAHVIHVRNVSERTNWSSYVCAVRALRERQVAGRDYLAAATALLQRARSAHPTKGLFEAADLQWLWRTPRATDQLGQLFWLDDAGHPEAAVIATDWGEWVGLDVLVMPDATPDWIAHVVERGLDHALHSGFEAVQMEVDQRDHVLRDVLFGRGFSIKEAGLAESWMSAQDRPAISPLHYGYRLCSRRETMQFLHHMIKRSGPDVERRLLQTSLYRDDLDLLVVDRENNCAAHGLFWFDPATSTGLVEPMRTEDEHQRRGLARHILTTGVDLLTKAGAMRIKICFEPDNPASSNLYLDVGFQPVKQTDVFTGRTSKPVRG